MKKTLLTTFFVLIGVPLMLVLAGYLALSVHYADTFLFGIYVNDIYVSGQTPKEVDAELLKYIEPGVLTIIPKEEEPIELALSDIDFTYSYLTQLNRLKDSDNPVRWAERMLVQAGGFTEYTIEPSYQYDADKLQKLMESEAVLSDCSARTNLQVKIVRAEDGYVLRDDTAALLDGEKAKAAIEDAISEGRESVNLVKEDCYIHKEYTPGMKETLKLWNKIDRLQSCEITYLFGEHEELVDASVTSDWIKLDENGEFFLDEDGNPGYDEEAVKAYVKDLADTYNTTDRVRTFHTTSGRNVTIKNTNYGDKLDEKAEVEYLLEAAAKGRKEKRVPVYSQRAFAEGEDDIGDTYIEVDMSEQMMYYYQAGRIVIETPVVTGNTSLGRGTPEKICYVYYKQRNRVLRGEDYETPVSYWIAVNGNIGIHDANWRWKFGGTIYKTNGSHGCINTPTKEVSKLYDMVELGTPVIIFY